MRCYRPGFICVLLAALASPSAGAQSIDVTDGMNAVGIGLFWEVSPDDTDVAAGVSTTFSVAGVMDIGASYTHESRSVDGVWGYDRSIGFIYNLLFLSQSRGMPITLITRFSYGLSFADQNLAIAEFNRELATIGNEQANEDVERVERTSRHYSIGLGVSRAFSLGRRTALRIGADAEYRVVRNAYTPLSLASAEDNDEDADPSALITEPVLSMVYGPSIALRVRMSDEAIASIGAGLLFDGDGQLIVRPDLNLTLLRYR